MTQKELLLKDLCARLPYGVIVKDRNGIHELTPGNTEFTDLFNSNKCNIKPYLRPLSSMTPEEKKYIKYKWGYSDWDTLNDFIDYTLIDTCDAESFIDWLNENYFDYRGLIEKGLAIEAPREMYFNQTI